MKEGPLTQDAEWIRVPAKTAAPGYAFVARMKDELGQVVDILARLSPATGKEERHV